MPIFKAIGGDFIKKKSFLICLVLVFSITTTSFASERSNHVDLRKDMPPIWNQSDFKSCTAQAVCASLAYQFKAKRNVYFEPSRRFVYYMTRLDNSEVHKDEGASIRSACSAIVNYGTCYENAYPEITSLDMQPNFNNLYSAARYKANAYYKLTSFEDIMESLNKKIPVVFSTNMSRWGNVGKDGIVKMALKWEQSPYKQGHAMLIVGYIPNFNIDGIKTSVFIVRNSYGHDWGDDGYAYVPALELYKYNLKEAYVLYVDEKPSNISADDRLKYRFYNDKDNYFAVKAVDPKGELKYIHRDYLGEFLKEGYIIVE